MVVYRENEKENGSYYLVYRGKGEENGNYPKGNCCNISLYRDNGKKNGNYCLRFYGSGFRVDYLAPRKWIMEKKMETTIL